jgi:L-malate glycosyltransferase
VNVDREHICQALAEAKLFWHTAGLLNDEAKSPNNAEHFGIATVEAMRAGCVPLVINSGGQREIIQNPASGFLCEDMEELVRNSVAVARDERGWRELSRQAYIRSRAFGSETFERRVSEIVSEWVHTGENCRAHTPGDESETAPSLVGGFHEP